MNLATKLLATCTAVALLVTSLSVGVFAARDDDDEIKPRSVAIKYNGRTYSDASKDTVTISNNRDVTMEEVIRPNDAYVDTDVTWDSSNRDVADIDDNGYLTTYEPGYTIITVRTANRKSATVLVYVPGKVEAGNENPYRDDNDQQDTDATDPTKATQPAATTPAATQPKPTTPATTVSSGNTVSLTEKITSDALVNAVRSAGDKSATLQGYAAVPVDAIKAATAVSKKNINFDTRLGNRIIGRLVITPERANDLTGDVLTGVYVDSGNTAAVQTSFDKAFKNTKKVILTEQSNFHMFVEIVVPVGDMKADNLKFYTYDKDNNLFAELAVANPWKDSSNYLHFTTSTGGYIIVSDGALTK